MADYSRLDDCSCMRLIADGITGLSLSINNSNEDDLYNLNISLILDLKDFIPS